MQCALAFDSRVVLSMGVDVGLLALLGLLAAEETAPSSPHEQSPIMSTNDVR
jgi:hypothetical protein